MPGMRLGNRPGRRDVSELRGLSGRLRRPRALRRIGSVGLEAAARAPEEFPEAAGGRRALPANNFAGRRVAHDCVVAAAVLVRSVTNPGVAAFGAFYHEGRSGILADGGPV